MKSGNRIVNDRQQYVVKANELIRKTRYSLTTQQQKIVLYAISKIRPNDLPSTTYELRIDEICAACGINIRESGGRYYQTIKDDLRELTKREWCKMPDRSEKTISWIGDADIQPNNGTVTISFNPNMAPYLFDLREKYTQYRLENVLVFKGKYSIRLYEVLRSFMTQRQIDGGIEKVVDFSVEELRQLLDISDESYPRWADFNRFVIRKAVDEINLCCDEFNVSYTTSKRGKEVYRVNFLLSRVTPLQRFQVHEEKRKRL